MLLLACAAAISFGAWLFHHGAGFISGGILGIVWVWVCVVDFPDNESRA